MLFRNHCRDTNFKSIISSLFLLPGAILEVPLPAQPGEALQVPWPGFEVLKGRWQGLESEVAWGHGLHGSDNQVVHLCNNHYSLEDIEATPAAEVIVDPRGNICLGGAGSLDRQASYSGKTDLSGCLVKSRTKPPDLFFS